MILGVVVTTGAAWTGSAWTGLAVTELAVAEDFPVLDLPVEYKSLLCAPAVIVTAINAINNTDFFITVYFLVSFQCKNNTVIIPASRKFPTNSGENPYKLKIENWELRIGLTQVLVFFNFQFSILNLLKSCSEPLKTLKSVYSLMPSTLAWSVNCHMRHCLSVTGRTT